MLLAQARAEQTVDHDQLAKVEGEVAALQERLQTVSQSTALTREEIA